MRAAIYARVSTKDKGQETSNQTRILEEFCNNPASGYTHVATYLDNKTGSTADREQFKQMFEDASQRKFDVILFWSLDRFSREGALATLQHLERLNKIGIGWRSYTEQYLDSAGIFKDAIISIMATLAKQERLRISERTIAGLKRAKAQAAAEGREWHSGRGFKIMDRDKVREMRASGKSLREVGNAFGISYTQVGRICNNVHQPKTETQQQVPNGNRN